MNPAFFPRDWRFWQYHASAMAMIVALTMLSAALWRQLDGNALAASLAWTLPYTAVVLAFRWWYLRRSAPMALSRLIPLVVVYGTVAGVIVAGVVTLATAPYYWDHMYSPYIRDVLKLSPLQFVMRNALSGGAQTQLLICAWIFVYVGIDTSRRAQDAELLNERLRASLKEAQLSSLSNQLNPHFLFNALNNIRFMAHEDVNQSDAMLVALSELLRYSLESSKHDKVPLSQEVRIVERYMMIAKTQLEDRLRFSMHIDDQLAACLVPPMVLQMLVENAVKHGIDQCVHGGALELEARAQGTQVRLRVSNDAPPRAAPPDAPPGGMQIGLQNIRARLGLLYGAQTSMECTQQDNRFTVAITLPMESAQ